MESVLLVLALLTLLGGTEAQAIPSSLGVNIHFTKPRPGEMEMLAAAGWTHVRMDFTWSSIEKKKGVYDFSEYDILMNELTKRSITPIFILDYGNPLYDNGLAPHTDEGRHAFANFSVAGVLRYKGRGIHWEMWNEPNGGFWHPKPDAKAYSALAKVVGKAIKAVAPEEKFIGPTTSYYDWTYLTDCFQNGVLEYFDAVSLHGYGEQPEQWMTNHAQLQQLIRKFTNKELPIINSEWGQTDIAKGMNKEIQAKWLVRQYLATLYTKAPITIWYDWHDDGTNATYTEDHFGTVYYTYHPNATPVYDPKPAYIATQIFIKEMRGFTFSESLRVSATDKDTYAFLFKNDNDEYAIVAWCARATNHTAQIYGHNQGNECFHAIDFWGKSVGQHCMHNNVMIIPLSDAPLYLKSTKI